MPSAKIPYAASLASGLDEISDEGATPLVRNCLVDAAGTIRQRPGIAAYQSGSSLGTPIGAGLWNGYCVYATADRKIHALHLLSGTLFELSDTTSATQLDGSGQRAVFAGGKYMLIIAGGGAPQKWIGTGLSSRLAGSPGTGSHVSIIGQRAVLTPGDNTGRFYYSGLASDSVADYETWGGNYQEAESRPDPLIAIYDNAREMYAFGTETTQIYGVSPDATIPYAVLNTINNGCGARYTPIQTDLGYAWLDDRRRFIHSNGRIVDVISNPTMANTIGALSTVYDAWGFRARIGAFDLWVWLFPSEKRTFVYEAIGKRWSEWSSFSAGENVATIIGSYVYWADGNKHLVGDTGGNGMCSLSMDAYTDLGSPLVAEIRTGFVDHGTMNRKWAQYGLYALRRGAGGSPMPQLEVRDRPSLGAWRPWRRLPIGAVGDYDIVARDNALAGIYRKRQHHARFSGNALLSLASAEEVFIQLDS